MDDSFKDAGNVLLENWIISNQSMASRSRQSLLLSSLIFSSERTSFSGHITLRYEPPLTRTTPKRSEVTSSSSLAGVL